MGTADRIALDEDTWLLVLTGAGVSAESGVPTFRDSNGLWESHRVEDVASPEGFARDPLLVWRFYGERRKAAAGVEPNEGHRALVRAEKKLGDRFLLATQNVDGLHTRAGSERVVEMHGTLFKTRCSRCDRPPFEDQDTYENAVPGCGKCQRPGSTALLRPHIVWFGEMLDPADLHRIERFAQSAASSGGKLVFLAAGTSGNVFPAAGLVDAARKLGADTWLVNAEPAENTRRFAHFARGPSGTLLPALLD